MAKDANAGIMFNAIRPEDGMEVTMTCTPKQWEEVWVPKGYTKVKPVKAEAAPAHKNG